MPTPMVSRKEPAARSATAIAPNGTAAPKVRSSRIPPLLRFPLLVILSLSLNFFLYSVAGDTFIRGELGEISRGAGDEWWVSVGYAYARKIAELGVCWFGGFDGYDIAYLTFLTHTPYFFLLGTCYDRSLSTILICLLIDTTSNVFPTSLLRPIDDIHNPNAPASVVPNRYLLNDLQIRMYSTLWATAIYTLVLYFAQRSELPVFLVTHFDGLRNLTLTHDGKFQALFLSLLPYGYAAQGFLLTPSLGASQGGLDAKLETWVPEEATLGETLRWNVWGWSQKTKVLIKRTSVLLTVVGLYTWAQVLGTVAGADSEGAMGWAALWSAPAILAGFAFAWVEGGESVGQA